MLDISVEAVELSVLLVTVDELELDELSVESVLELLMVELETVLELCVLSVLDEEDAVDVD